MGSSDTKTEQTHRKVSSAMMVGSLESKVRLWFRRDEGTTTCSYWRMILSHHAPCSDSIVGDVGIGFRWGVSGN